MAQYTDIAETEDLNLEYARLVDAFNSVAKKSLPIVSSKPKKPWISATTLSILDARANARRDGRFEDEKDLSKQIRTSVAQDRSNWLDNLVQTSDWASIRKF